MSLNAIRDKKYQIQIEAAKKVLALYGTGLGTLRQTLLNTRSEEEKAVVEAEIIDTLEKLFAQTFSLSGIEGQELSYTDVQAFTNGLAILDTYRSECLNALGRLYVDYYNAHQMAMMDLSGKHKRIRQKKAVLDLWTDTEDKWAIAEKFLNGDVIDSSLISQPMCSVDTNQGYLTLPVSSTRSLGIGSLSISAGSNGQPGNSDQAVDFSINDITNVIADNELWFEYEKLDNGPVDLVLNFQLSKEDIVNNIEIVPADVSLPPFQVVDISLVSSSSNFSIRDFLPSSLSQDFFSVRGKSAAPVWSITIPPVPARNIIVRLRQTASVIVKTWSRDLVEVERNRFGLALEQIRFNCKSYGSKGAINSKNLKLPGDLYVCTGSVTVSPPQESFHSIGLDVTTDDGQAWSSDLLTGDGWLMEGTEEKLNWRLNVELKNDYNLATLKNDSSLFEVESLTKLISGTVSPQVCVISSDADGDEVFCQRKVLRRTDNPHKVFSLGKGKGIETLFPLPFDIDEFGVTPDECKVYVNKREWTEVSDSSLLASGTFMFSEDHNSLVFGAALPDKASVGIALSEEKCLFTEKSDGFYVAPKLGFNPQRCVFTHIPSAFSRKVNVLPRGKTRIVLGPTGIDSTSFVLSSVGGASYTAKSDRSSLAVAGDYYIDTVNGILYLYESIDDDIVRCQYRYQSRSLLGASEYDVVYEDLRPTWLRLPKSLVATHQITDIVGGSLYGRIDILTGSYGSRSNLFPSSTTAMTLSHDYVVKGSVVVGPGLMGYSGDELTPVEVDYVDGYSEFLGLIPIEKEITTAISADGTGRSSFTLAAGALWYSTLGVSFSDTSVFATEKSSLSGVTAAGDYHVDSGTGGITLYGDIPQGIELSYFYRDVEWDSSNRYSVDYVNGTLYTSQAMVNDATVQYKATSYKLAYDVCEDLPAEYSAGTRSVKIDTSDFEGMSFVSIFWKKGEAISEFDFSRCYSPVIYSLGLRFE
jgi:hypothetical protein